MSAVGFQQESLLVKALAGRAWVAGAVMVSVALSGGTPAEALPHGTVASAPGISVVAEGAAERWIVDLGGVLVAALSPEAAAGGDGLLLLVRPPRKPDGPRRLLRLRLEPEPRLEVLGEGLDGGLEALAAVELGGEGGLELVAGGPDGSWAAICRHAAVPRGRSGGWPPPVVETAAARGGRPRPAGILDSGRLHRGVDRGFAAAEPGRLKIWRSAGKSSDGDQPTEL